MDDNNRNENPYTETGQPENPDRYHDGPQPDDSPQGYNSGPDAQYGQYVQNGSDPQYGQYQQYGQNSMNQQYAHYQSGPYPQYGGFEKPDSRAGSGFGIAAMILGILSLVLFCTCINIPLAIAAVVLAVIQMTRNTQARGMAIAGIVTAALSIVLFAAALVLVSPVLSRYMDELQNMPRSGYDSYDDYLDDFDDYFDFFDNDGYNIPHSDGHDRPDAT